MLQPRIRSSPAATELSLNSLAAALNSIALCPKHAAVKPPLTFVRYASHAAQGRANGPKDSDGRRLGAKKTASEYVIPGNIIYKQRGTKWFPGENVGIGKDHTIYAKVAGYVRYYRNPIVHPKRRYIGVALEKDGPASKLPTPVNAPTRRRLGMYAVPIKEPTDDRAFLEAHMSADSAGSKAELPPQPATPNISLQAGPLSSQAGLTMRDGGFRVANFEIGRAAERKGIIVKEFQRKDRWTAWRKRAKKSREKMAARAARANRKTKGKKSNKGIPKTNK